LTRLEGRVDRLNTVPQAGRPAASYVRLELLPQYWGTAIGNINRDQQQKTDTEP